MGEELGKGNIHHFKWITASSERVSSPDLKTLTQGPVGILITAVKLDCVDPLKELYCRDRWGRVFMRGGKQVEARTNGASIRKGYLSNQYWHGVCSRRSSMLYLIHALKVLFLKALQ